MADEMKRVLKKKEDEIWFQGQHNLFYIYLFKIKDNKTLR